MISIRRKADEETYGLNTFTIIVLNTIIGSQLHLWQVDQKWNYVKLESIRTLLKIIRLAYRKSYIGPNEVDQIWN